jgi:hypothetical protein
MTTQEADQRAAEREAWWAFGEWLVVFLVMCTAVMLLMAVA